MANADPTTSLAPEPDFHITHFLDALPDALFFVEDNGTILYANAAAATSAGMTKHELLGNTLRRCAPHLVSAAFYQAMIKAIRTRKPLQVEYFSPDTSTWLHVHLSPFNEGIAAFFSEETEPTRPQDALNRNEQMYRDLLESFADRVAILTPDGLVLNINQHSLADAHVWREEVMGKPFTNLPEWSHDPTVQQQLREAIARARRGETVHFEARIHPRTDMYLDLLMTITPYYNASQQAEYLICASRDITERKHAENDLCTLVDAIPHFVWTRHPDGCAEYGNQRWRDYIGKAPEQLQGDEWLQFVHPDDRQRIQEAWQTAVRTGTPYEVELRIQHSSTGDYRWFLARGIPLRDHQGTILRWFGTSTDIEDQKRAEQQSKTSEENWRILAETVPQLIWTTRPDGFVTYSNQRFRDYVGASISGYEWRQFVHPDDYERVQALRCHSLETGKPYESEYRLRHGQTGMYRWFLVRALPIHDEAGRITKWFGTSTDIEDQKRAEEALRQSQKRMHALIASNIIGIISTEEREDVLIEANDAFLRMTGYTQEDIRSRTLHGTSIIIPEDDHFFQNVFQELSAHGQVTPFEAEVVCKDESRLPVLVGGAVFQEHPRQIISFVLDNSARKELEQRKNDFINIASHELRNPLAALKLQTTLLHRQLSKRGILAFAPALSNMEVQINKVTRLVEELLDVSKIQAGRLEYLQETVDLDALLKEITDTLQQINPNHTFAMRGTVGASLIGDRERLEQVFTNLISNAIKYSPDAETIEIDLSTSPGTATIRVRDHGIGIPREQRDKIFERFYRVTDLQQKKIPGLGMGLYIAAEIVKHHGGTITVDSAVGKGSTFTVILPLKREIFA